MSELLRALAIVGVVCAVASVAFLVGEVRRRLVRGVWR
jgi:hypothetical protein